MLDMLGLTSSLRNVVFPAPLAPRRTTRDPRVTVTVASERTFFVVPS